MVSASRKRLVCIAAGLAALCVVGYLVAPYAPIEALLVSSLWLLIATPILVAAILLLRRVGGLGTLLQVVGSAALFLASVFKFISSLIAHYAYRKGLGDPLVLLRSPNSVAAVPLKIVLYLTPLFPLGFLLYALRVKQRTI